MRKFRIEITNGKVFAPQLLVYSSKPENMGFEDALKQAREKSGLSRFKCWTFTAFHVFDKSLMKLKPVEPELY